MLRWPYTLLTTLLLPLFFCRLWWRGRRNPDYRRRWNERLARYRQSPSALPCVVFHAVSVGEVHGALPLLESFLQRHPQVSLVVTTTTPTGSARVQQLLGSRVLHVYLPYDLPGCWTRFFRQFRPQMLVLMETELWPNLVHHCKTAGCPVLLINARLSSKSMASYQRFPALTHTMMQQMTLVSAQSSADGERFVALGLPVDKLQVTGSVKFDLAINSGQVAAARQQKSQWSGRPVWIAASTREGEDALVLQAWQQAAKQFPALLLVLVPRHPERFQTAQDLAVALGLNTVRQRGPVPVTADTQVLIGDTLGDMHFYYALADLAFVGGSLVPTGCQNIIEAAALGLPVLTGPSLYNFQAASDELRAAGAMRVVADADALAKAVIEMLQDNQLRLSMAQKALAVVAGNAGATSRTLDLIETYWCNH